MDRFDADLYSLLPYAIDAFSHVYGEEYRQKITDRLKHTVIFRYNDVQGLNEYILYIKKCKSREFCIRFLEEIGMDVKKYKKDNYTERFDTEICIIINQLIDDFFGFYSFNKGFVPILAFDDDVEITNKISVIPHNRVRVINYFLNDKENEITEENLEEFSKTDKYLEIEKIVKGYIKIYNKLHAEYDEWAKQFESDVEYINSENERRNNILNQALDDNFDNIISLLPTSSREFIFNMPHEKQKEIILVDDIESKYVVEYFSDDCINKLKNVEEDSFGIYFIIKMQLKYLKKFGIKYSDVNEYNLYSNTDLFTSKEGIEKYISFLNQKDVKKYIPSNDNIELIAESRKNTYSEAIKKYYITRDDFLSINKRVNNGFGCIDRFYDIFKTAGVCILGGGAHDDDGNFLSTMFYTIRENGKGNLLQIFMHELGHAIDQSKIGCGFEIGSSYNDDYKKNPYDSECRFYEKFNETLNDIFAIEATEYLHNKGLYFLEKKEFVRDASNNNTALVTKNLLKPLVEYYRKQIVLSKINQEPYYLIEYIGKENFEELVDAVNKVDYLSRNNLLYLLDHSPEDDIVKEYNEQLKRAKQIYLNIDKYYNDVYLKNITEIKEKIKNDILPF